MAENNQPQLVEFYYVTEQDYKNAPKNENALYFTNTGRLFKGEMEVSPKNSVLTYDSVYNFPSVGKVNTMYIDKSTEKTYRWDDDRLSFICIGSNYEDIQIINGNFL